MKNRSRGPINALLLRFSVVISLVTPSIANAQHARTLNPGLWEVSIIDEVPAQGPPSKLTVCISPEQAVRMTAQPKSKNSDCRIAIGVSNAAVLEYATTCDQTHVSTQTRLTFTGDTYSGVMTTRAGSVETRQVYTGRRLGNCSPPEPED